MFTLRQVTRAASFKLQMEYPVCPDHEAKRDEGDCYFSDCTYDERAYSLFA